MRHPIITDKDENMRQFFILLSDMPAFSPNFLPSRAILVKMRLVKTARAVEAIINDRKRAILYSIPNRHSMKMAIIAHAQER